MADGELLMGLTVLAWSCSAFVMAAAWKMVTGELLEAWSNRGLGLDVTVREGLPEEAE